jgi:hypothetical protein
MTDTAGTAHERVSNIIYHYAQTPIKSFRNPDIIAEMVDRIVDTANARDIFERDDVGDLEGRTYKVPVAMPHHAEDSSAPVAGSMYVTVGGQHGRPLEVFVRIGKAGSDAAILADSVARLASGWLQDGVDPKKILKHLLGTRSYASVFWVKLADQEDKQVKSIPDGIGKAIKLYMSDYRWQRPEVRKAAAKKAAPKAPETPKMEEPVVVTVKPVGAMWTVPDVAGNDGASDEGKTLQNTAPKEVETKKAAPAETKTKGKGKKENAVTKELPLGLELPNYSADL